MYDSLQYKMNEFTINFDIIITLNRSLIFRTIIILD